MIGPSDIQIILGKVRPLPRPLAEGPPQVLIIAHLHQPDPCQICIGLTQEGSGPFTIGMKWAPDELLSQRKSWTQSAGEKQVEGTAALAWARPLELYRPILSYGELGRLFDSGPSGLYDALAKLLGLEVLTDAEKWIVTQLKTTKQARDGADAERKRINGELAASDDERAKQAVDLLRKRSIDLEAVLSLATGSGEQQLDTVQRLRRIASISVPTIDAIEAATQRLRAAVGAFSASASTLVDQTEQRVAVLRAAVRFFDGVGDSDCPVCGQGHLDSAWAQHARDSIAESDAALVDHRDAIRERDAARLAARAMVESLAQIAEVEGVELASLSGYNAAVSIALITPDDDGALAEHLESALAEVAATSEVLREQAASEAAQRESTWAPLAAKLGGWVQMELEARERDPAVTTLNGAKKWVTDHAADFRKLRIEPIAAQARWIWSQLRQESNVDLGDINLEGTNTKRRVTIEGTVDGQPTKALSVMSQGEQHALALALFLPRATAAASPFRFVVLDDPIQAMDPAKVDGFVGVLTEIAKTHQVIVFSHDDRLASVVRETGVDARMVEVVREAGSKVSVRDNVNPALRQVEDVIALLKDDKMPPEVKNRAAPGLFRLAVELAAKQSYFARQSVAGEPRTRWEDNWQATKKTRNRLALAITGDSQTDITSWLDSNHARKRTLRICNAGVHGAVGELTIYDARDLERTVQELLRLK